MKFLLTLVMCSGVAGHCMPPFEVDKRFDGLYDCLKYGYAESVAKIAEIGPADIDQHLIHIKFYCSPVQET